MDEIYYALAEFALIFLIAKQIYYVVSERALFSKKHFFYDDVYVTGLCLCAISTKIEEVTECDLMITGSSIMLVFFYTIQGIVLTFYEGFYTIFYPNERPYYGDVLGIINSLLTLLQIVSFVIRALEFSMSYIYGIPFTCIDYDSL